MILDAIISLGITESKESRALQVSRRLIRVSVRRILQNFRASDLARFHPTVRDCALRAKGMTLLLMRLRYSIMPKAMGRRHLLENISVTFKHVRHSNYTQSRYFVQVICSIRSSSAYTAKCANPK